MKITLYVIACLFVVPVVNAAENCTPEHKGAHCLDSVVQERVDWACKTLAEKDKDVALKEIKKMRFDCCDESDYVWINDMRPYMIMHPIKSALDGKDLTENKDPDGKHLFIEFVKAVKAKPEGDWVNYKWTKLGEEKPTSKKSWVRACQAKGEKEKWVVGSGTWYD